MHPFPPTSRYLENLCDYLYDDLRPRILHEPRLTVLCQVSTILQALMVLDITDLSDSDSSPSSPSSPSFPTKPDLTADPSLAARFIQLVGAEPDQAPKPLRRLHIARLLEMILQDAQTRLFFKAQAVIQSDIRYYTPSAEDLDYPARLRAPTTAVDTSLDDLRSPISAGEELFASLPSKDMMSTWYPTLQKLHWILGLLHDFVKVRGFIPPSPPMKLR